MTDEREPTPTDPTPDDATSRVPTPTTPTPTPAVPPTAPLTPASQATSTPPTFEHEVAWASGPVPASPVVPPAKPPRRGGRVRWAVSLAVVAVVVADLGRGRRPHHRAVVDLDRPRLRPGRTRRLRRGPPRPARRPARAPSASSSRSSRASPTRRRSTPSSTRSSTSWSRTRPNDEQSYTTNIKPWFDGELAFSVGPLPPAAALAKGGPSVAGHRPAALALLSIKDQALAPRRGSTRRSPRPAPRPRPRPTTARP